jgi:EAL domain-containing protein (putative c-di-GMP-specific phosphodiesterase class I)
MSHGWAAYDEAVREFAQILVGLRETGELGAQDVVCLQSVRSDRFIAGLAQDGPPDAAAGGRRELLLTALRKRLESANNGNLLRHCRFSTGHAWVGSDPMVRCERSIQQAVTEAMMMSLAEREGTAATRRRELARLIEGSGIRTVFHPIVRLTDQAVIGHEALTRPFDMTCFESVEDIFAFAESSDLLLDFERLCRRTAIRSAASVPGLGLLFLNASAEAVKDAEWSGTVERSLEASGLEPRDVVVEITERVAIHRHDEFQSALRTFKSRGYRVAVDDMGAGHASLQSLAAIEPDYLKFDVSLVRDIDRSRIKRSLLESLRQLAVKIGARVIAEGVERPEELETLRELGIELGQGFYFHREGA